MEFKSNIYDISCFMMAKCLLVKRSNAKEEAIK